MRFDEIRQKFDEIWPNNILMSHQKICPKSKINENKCIEKGLKLKNFN